MAAIGVNLNLRPVDHHHDIRDMSKQYGIYGCSNPNSLLVKAP